MRHFRLYAAGLFCAMAFAVAGCFSLERNPIRLESFSHPPVAKGTLNEQSRIAATRLPSGHSGFHLLTEADEALRWRLALVDHATRSIDIQYYLWNLDETGLLLFSRLIEAADRGVRVRLLIDDLLFKGEEEKLAALCHHPNIEIRIYNPQFTRSGGVASAVEILFRFQQLNRRMHNKVFIADNCFAILGGRNIGNEYFGLSQTYNFLDLDVMTHGPVVAEASNSFDLFWNSELSFPGEAFSPETQSDSTAEVVEAIHRFVREESTLLADSPYPLRRKDWTGEFSALRPRWHSGVAVLIDDVPTAQEETGERFMAKALARTGSPSKEETSFVSPYLIPNRQLHEVIRGYVDDGVEVRLLTASFGANNHLVVHSHYRQHRRTLLKDGVSLHELREDASDAIRAAADVSPVRSDKIALHVKAGVGDRTRCFIGSLNLDPRSIDHNTENGLLIESPGLANELADYLDFLMADENSWEVTLGRNGRLRWTSRGEVQFIQPAPDAGSRVKDFFLGLLPVKHLL